MVGCKVYASHRSGFRVLGVVFFVFFWWVGGLGFQGLGVIWGLVYDMSSAFRTFPTGAGRWDLGFWM